MNKENLTEILKEFYTASGFRVSFFTADMRSVASYPEQNHAFCSFIGLHSRSEAEECSVFCKNLISNASNLGRAVSSRCRHGLTEAVLPLYNYGVLSGYLVMSGVLPESESAERMIMALAHLGKRESDARCMALSMPSAADAKIASLIRMIAICAEHLSRSASSFEAKSSISVLIRKYIDENYKKHIGIKDICKAVGYSKSTVLNAFKSDVGMTVGAYICSVRLCAAAEMLRTSSLTVAEIAVKSGFADQSYFSKVFSAKFGITPTEYRKEESR